MTTQHDYTDRLDELSALPAGWLDGAGEPVTAAALRAARHLFDRIDTLDRASVFPIEDGGVSVEWLTEHQHTVVEVTADGGYDAYAVRLDGSLPGGPSLTTPAEATLDGVVAFVADALAAAELAAVVVPESLTVPGAGERKRVVLLRGLPGSGKSTAALKALAAATPGTAVRINNDDLVDAMLGGPATGTHGGTVAGLLAATREALLHAALADPGVRLVIVDNTNLNLRTVHSLHKLAAAAGADVVVDDTFLDVDVEMCVARDIRRGARGGRSVGRDVIEKMAAQARKLARPYRAPASVAYAGVRFEPYDNDPALPSTLIVDVDGTLALMDGRSPFDWSHVGDDVPNRPVVEVVRALLATGQHVTVMSGRDGAAYDATAAWLAEHVAPGLPLYMRAAGDGRPDFIVKHELFQAHIAGKYSVLAVIDDRDQVVRYWRGRGLPCWQVAEGDF